MNLPWRKPPPTTDLERDATSISFNEWVSLISSFEYAGNRYSLPVAMQEEIGGNFQSLTNSAYRANGIVFACIVTRMLLFSEARFQFRQQVKGRPGNLFGTPALAALETPWTGGTTGDLLSKMLVDADLAGNSFCVRRPGGIRRLRPDWVTIVLGSLENVDQTLQAWDADTDVVGYIYQPGGPGSGREPITYLAGEVAHFAPIPDPTAQYRGMSWLTPVIREIMGDKAMIDHKLSFLEQGATPNVVVTMDQPDLEKAKLWIELFKREHEGARNAYKTMFLGSGSDAKVIGTDLKQLDFKVVQGHSETRIAAAARVPPIIVGLSEGLEAATYSNYGQARRAFADATMRPLWRNAAGSLARIITVPPGAELWYDDRDIAFLQEDQKDAADIQSTQAQSIRTLVDGGYKPDTVVDAIVSGDLSRLVHTDLFSVQLQPPGTTMGPNGNTPAAPPPAPANGKRDDTIEMLEGLLRMSERPAPNIEVHVPPSRVEIGEGAIQSHVSLELPAGEAHRMEIAEGAIQSHVTVEPSRTEIQKGAVEVNVEPSDVTIEKGAVWVDVQPGDVNVAEGAFRTDVTVEPARIEKGAVEVTVEAPPPSNVEVNVEPPSVTLERGAVEVTVEPSTVTVEAAPTPDVTVNVEPPSVTLERGAVEVTVEPGDVTVEATDVQVDVHVPPPPDQELVVEHRAPDQPAPAAPVVNVTVEPTPITNEINVPPPANKTVRFTRNSDGEIVEAESEDTTP